LTKSRSRSILDVSDPYANYLIPVPPAGEGVCLTCHTSVHDGYSRCFACNRARNALDLNLLADAVAMVSMAPAGEQLARELYTYKKDSVPRALRQQRTIGLAAVLWRWLNFHEQHVAAAAGTNGFDLVTSIPSTNSRPGIHPLRMLVAQVVVGTDVRYRDLLLTARTDLGRVAASDRFAAAVSLQGQSVLVVDDTWTTGARAQSAAATLKLAGAQAVGFVAIGRWFTTGYRDDAQWIRNAKSLRWDWNRCCLE